MGAGVTLKRAFPQPLKPLIAVSVPSAGLVPLLAGPGHALPRAGPLPPDQRQRPKDKGQRRSEVKGALLRRGRRLRREGGRGEGEAGQAGRGRPEVEGGGRQVRGQTAAGAGEDQAAQEPGLHRLQPRQGGGARLPVQVQTGEYHRYLYSYSYITIS